MIAEIGSIYAGIGAEAGFLSSFTGGPLLSVWRGTTARALACCLLLYGDEDLYRPTGDQTHWDLGYLGTYAEDRQPAVERLLIEPARRLPGKRFVVAGPQYPSTIEWPANVERIEHLPAEHARFYSSCRFTPQRDPPGDGEGGWSPSVCPFEAAASGSAILSDPWPGLDEIFPPDEALLTVADSQSVVDALSAREGDRANRLARRARQRVLAEHTGERRAAQLEEVLKQASAANARGTQEEKRYALSS